MKSSILDRFERQATLLTTPRLRDGHVGDVANAMHETRLMPPRVSIGEIAELMGTLASDWKSRYGLIPATEPTAQVGYTGIEITPYPANQPTITSSATEQLIWASTQTPVIANPQVPKAYLLISFGYLTTAATQGTFTLNPRVGNVNTSPSLGISTAITPGASTTAAPFLLWGAMLIRTGGTSASAVGIFKYEMATNVAGSGPNVLAATNIFGSSLGTSGNAAASFDSTVSTNGLVFGQITATSTTNTIVPAVPIWVSLN
jgi:hypothetical protein